MQSLNTKITFNTEVLYIPLVGTWSGSYVLESSDREINFNQLCKNAGFKQVTPMPADLEYADGDMALAQRIYIGDCSLDVELRYRASLDRYTLAVYQDISRGKRALPEGVVVDHVSKILRDFFTLGKATHSHTYIPL
jgi:hypothetical protein